MPHNNAPHFTRISRTVWLPTAVGVVLSVVLMLVLPLTATAQTHSNGKRSLVVALAPDEGPAPLGQQVAKALAMALSEGSFQAVVQLRMLPRPIAPGDLSRNQVAKQLQQAVGHADLLVWSTTDRDGTRFYLLHTDGLEAEVQARQAAGLRPIVPMIHRLPDATDARQLAEAVRASLYIHSGQYQLAQRSLSQLLSNPLSHPVRYPLLFQTALTNLELGRSRRDGKLIDRALQHFEMLLPVVQRSGNPELIGATYVNLGIAYLSHPGRNDAELFSQASAAFEEALNYYPAHRSPVVRARVMHLLGTAEQRHPAGQDGHHLQRAIMAYKEALKTWHAERFPGAYRSALHNVALCFQRLRVGDRQRNLATAIRIYRHLLRLPSVRDFPVRQAALLGNLGQAYHALPPDQEERGLHAAITAYQLALNLWDQVRDPRGYGRLQQLAGQAYQQLLTGDRSSNLRHALSHYNRALSIAARTAHPTDFARIQIQRAGILAAQTGPGRRQRLLASQTAFREALAIISPEELPYLYEKVVKNLMWVEAQLQLSTSPTPSREGAHAD